LNALWIKNGMIPCLPDITRSIQQAHELRDKERQKKCALKIYRIHIAKENLGFLASHEIY